MTIVEDPGHSNGAPTVEGTGIRVKDIAVAYEHSGYDPDEITQLYPDLSLGDVHRALAYYYDHVDEFRSTEPAQAWDRCTVTRVSGFQSQMASAAVAGPYTQLAAKTDSVTRIQNILPMP
jgi:uncharacterized protein (DUF433 family)